MIYIKDLTDSQKDRMSYLCGKVKAETEEGQDHIFFMNLENKFKQNTNHHVQTCLLSEEDVKKLISAAANTDTTEWTSEQRDAQIELIQHLFDKVEEGIDETTKPLEEQ